MVRSLLSDADTVAQFSRGHQSVVVWGGKSDHSAHSWGFSFPCEAQSIM